MTPNLQHRAQSGSRVSYNNEATHVRQVKSGLNITDPATAVKRSFVNDRNSVGCG